MKSELLSRFFGVCGSGVELFRDSSSFTAQASEIVEPVTAHATALLHFDLCNPWGVEREYSLNTYSVGDFSNGSSLVVSTAVSADADSFEDLNTLFFTLFDERVDTNSIPGPELGVSVFLLLGFELLYDVHDNNP